MAHDNEEEPAALEKHSLPGTNQAGKGPGEREGRDPGDGPEEAEPRGEDHLEKHSLPGTNQAGKTIVGQ
jgi:hypothetical protein